jgi:hypothetical protein
VRPALWLFVLGLSLRGLFWLASDDRGAAWHAGFQGDAPLWQDLAHKDAHDLPDELRRLPLRPPGMQWLVSGLWDGDPSTAVWLRGLFVVLGAALAPLVWLVLRRHVAHSTAIGAAAFTAVAGNLLLLGSGLHSELPYLLLFVATLFDQERLAQAPTGPAAARYGALHAALCLLRTEHLLTVALLLPLAVLRSPRERVRTTLFAAVAFFGVLLPWQLYANHLVDTYNQDSAPVLPAAGEPRPSGLRWQQDALARVRLLPAFQQAPVLHFVEDTLRARGQTAVTAADLAVVEQAYGCWPEPLPHAFVCLYGPLNFFLANTPEAAAGFSQRALDRTPPLTGGLHRYPPGLLQVLPRGGQLALSYPPHLDLVVHGYRRGLAELAADPAGAATRCLQKLWHGLEGAASGCGGHALPIGMSGVRRAVDLVTAAGTWPAIWRVLLLVVAGAGLWTCRRAPWLWAWLAFAVSKVAVLLLFFGYARQGALLVPVVGIGLAAAASRWLLPRWPGAARLGIWFLAALVALELARALGGTAVLVDGRVGPWPLDHETHVLLYR